MAEEVRTQSFNPIYRLALCMLCAAATLSLALPMASAEEELSRQEAKAYQAYLEEQKRAEQERLSGLEQHRKNKEAREKAKIEARESFQRTPEAEKEKAYQAYLKKYRKSLDQKEKQRSQFVLKNQSDEDDGRLSYHDLGGVLVKDRDRISHDKRPLYTDAASPRSRSGRVRGGESSPAPRSGRFERRNESRNERDRRDDPRERRDAPPVDSRRRMEEPPSHNEPPLPPPAFMDEPPPPLEEPMGDEPPYPEDFEDRDMEGDYPIPPPPPPDLEGDY